MKMKTLHKKDLSIWVLESYMISPFAFILTALLYLGIDGQNTVWKASTRLLVSRTEKKKKQWSLKCRHSLSKFVSSPLKSLNLEDPLTKHFY